MKRWVIYTALFGDYDRLVEPKEAWPDFDFVCFTDQTGLSSPLWKIVEVESDRESPVELNRKHKMLPHRYLVEYEGSLYVDSNIQILRNPRKLMEDCLRKGGYLQAKHSLRECVYEEAKECVIFKKAGYTETIRQVIRYRTEGFPAYYGMSENGVMFRDHRNTEVINLMEQWWEEYRIGSRRDQLSLPYVLWKNGRTFSLGDFTVDDGVYFRKSPHKKEVLRPWKKLLLSFEIRARRLYYSFVKFG